MSAPSDQQDSPSLSPSTIAGGVALLGVLIACLIVLPELRRHVRGDVPPPSDLAEPADGAGAESADAAADAEDVAEEEAPPATAIRPAAITGAKTIAALPLDERSVETMHDRSRTGKCEVLPPGEAVRVTSFQQYLTDRDTRGWDGEPTALSTRRPVLSVGLDMLPGDRSDLPALSRGEILKYLSSRYITIQARVQKDPVTGEIFLHHRPIAAMAPLPTGTLTESMSDELVETLQNYRGVGVFLPEGEEPIAANLRTMVLLNRSERLDPGSAVPRLRFEYLFVHGQPKSNRVDADLDLHAFATSDDRTVLHWLRDDKTPRRVDDCCLVSFIRFTDFSHGGFYPSESQTRYARIDARASFAVDDLTAYSKEQGWGEGAFDRLPALLDAILAGDVAPSAVGAQSTAGDSTH